MQSITLNSNQSTVADGRLRPGHGRPASSGQTTKLWPDNHATPTRCGCAIATSPTADYAVISENLSASSPDAFRYGYPTHIVINCREL